jgi:hypothetical protein
VIDPPETTFPVTVTFTQAEYRELEMLSIRYKVPPTRIIRYAVVLMAKRSRKLRAAKRARA